MATNKQQQTISTTDQKNGPTSTTDRIHGTPTPTNQIQQKRPQYGTQLKEYNQRNIVMTLMA